MLDDTMLTQNQSKFLVEWLRKKYGLRIANKIEFWNLRPSRVVDQLKEDFKLEVTVEQINIAARRNGN